MKIRPATVSDALVLAEFNRIAHDKHVEAFPERFRRDTPDQVVADAFAQKLQLPTHYSLIAEEDGPIAALRADFLDIPENWHSVARRVCYLAGIVVLPAYRRQGVARALLETLQREAEARGAMVELDVWAFNAEARQAFSKLGFASVMERMGIPAKRPNQALEPTAAAGRGSS